MSPSQTSISRSRYNLRPRKGRLASWQTLPTEIWSIIFYFALPDDWESYAALGRRRLKYAEVCRAWRSIAFATTRLWTSIVIDFTTLRHDLAMADLVERTGQAPLHIKILGPGGSMRDATSCSFWKQICALSHRWASLRIWVDNLETACQELGGEFPLLRFLSMWQGRGDTSFGNPLRFFGSAPNVSRLKIRWARASDRQTLPAVLLTSAWSLTHLDLNLCNCTFVDPQLSPLTVAVTAVTVCGDTLRSARLAWETDDSSPLIPLTEPVVTLPSLENLELQREATGMLLIMAAPNLQKLLLGGKPAPKVSLTPFTYYGGLQPPEDLALSRLRTFLDRSDDCPRLRDLHLCRVQLDGALDYLRRLNSLVCLEIVSYVANDAGLSVVRGLIRDPTVPTSMALLPCLKVLTICHEEWVKQRIVRRPFCAAVRSRRIPGTLGSSTLAIIETCHTHCSHTLLHGSFHMSDGDQGEYDMTVDRIDGGFDLRLP